MSSSDAGYRLTAVLRNSRGGSLVPVSRAPSSSNCLGESGLNRNTSRFYSISPYPLPKWAVSRLKTQQQHGPVPAPAPSRPSSTPTSSTSIPIPSLRSPRSHYPFLVTSPSKFGTSCSLGPVLHLHTKAQDVDERPDTPPRPRETDEPACSSTTVPALRSLAGVEVAWGTLSRTSFPTPRRQRRRLTAATPQALSPPPATTTIVHATSFRGPFTLPAHALDSHLVDYIEARLVRALQMWFDRETYAPLPLPRPEALLLGHVLPWREYLHLVCEQYYDNKKVSRKLVERIDNFVWQQMASHHQKTHPMPAPHLLKLALVRGKSAAMEMLLRPSRHTSTLDTEGIPPHLFADLHAHLITRRGEAARDAYRTAAVLVLEGVKEGGWVGRDIEHVVSLVGSQPDDEVLREVVKGLKDFIL